MSNFSNLQVGLHYVLKSHFPLFADNEGSTWVLISRWLCSIFNFSWEYENFLLIAYSGIQRKVRQVSQACLKWIEIWERYCLGVLILVLGWGCLWKWVSPCVKGSVCVIWTSHPHQERWLGISLFFPISVSCSFSPIDPSLSLEIFAVDPSNVGHLLPPLSLLSSPPLPFFPSF